MPRQRKLDDEKAKLVRDVFTRRRSINAQLTALKAQYGALRAELASIPSTASLASEMGMAVRSLFYIARGTTYKRGSNVDASDEG